MSTIKVTNLKQESSSTNSLVLTSGGDTQIIGALGLGGATYGTSGQVLTSAGSGSTPTWTTPTSLSNAEDGTGTNFEFNSGFGSNGVAYGVRAWARINGTGTISEYGKGGFSSITDQSTGVYRFNFTNAMPDTNYAVAGSTDTNTVFQVSSTFNTGYIDTSIQNQSGSTADSDDVSVIVVR